MMAVAMAGPFSWYTVDEVSVHRQMPNIVASESHINGLGGILSGTITLVARPLQSQPGGYR